MSDEIFFATSPEGLRMHGSQPAGRHAAAARNDDNNLHTKSHCAQNYYLISNQSNILSFFITCEL